MMSTNTRSKRGGILRGVAWMAAALGAFLLVVALFAFRGGRIQQELHETGNRLKDSLPELKERFPALPDLPDIPDLPAPPENAPGSDQTGTPPDGNGVQPEGGRPEPASPAPGDSQPRPEPPVEEVYTVENPPPVAKARHKVGKGDTLYSLAETYYEDGKLWKLIARANNLRKPSDLREGMVVVIPGVPQATSP